MPVAIAAPRGGKANNGASAAVGHDQACCSRRGRVAADAEPRHQQRAACPPRDEGPRPDDPQPLVQGKSESARVALGCTRTLKTTTATHHPHHHNTTKNTTTQ